MKVHIAFVCALFFVVCSANSTNYSFPFPYTGDAIILNGGGGRGHPPHGWGGGSIPWTLFISRAGGGEDDVQIVAPVAPKPCPMKYHVFTQLALPQPTVLLFFFLALFIFDFFFAPRSSALDPRTKTVYGKNG